MNKHDVAKVLYEIGVLLELQGGNPFKIRAYQNAARAIENLDEDIEQIVKSHKLQEIPAIGDRIAKKISTLILKGRLPFYERLKASMPETLIELMTVSGLGGKKIKALYDHLGICTIEELSEACKKGEVAQIRGFGPKTQENILISLEKRSAYSLRFLWWDAVMIAAPIVDELSKLKEVQAIEIAGSLRRKLETVGDLDIVVASLHPEPVMDCFTGQAWVSRILARGATKSSIRLKQGLQADLRVVPKKEFPYALVYFTGSRDFNIKLRQRALGLGFSLSEYGLEPLKKSPRARAPKARNESEVFKLLGLDYIQPELRENMGEVEAAENHQLPELIQEKDLRGVFHCHTTDSDGHNTLEEMAAAAQEIGWEYIGISDHSLSSFQANGMDEKRLFNQIERISLLNQSKKYAVKIFAGLECDIQKNGRLDFPDSVLKELDFVIVSVHRSFSLSETQMTSRMIKAIENPYTTMVGHVTGRLLLKRDPYQINLTKVIDACIANQKVMELNAQPSRLDMDWRLWKRAKEKGLMCCINPDAHRVGELYYYLNGVYSAKKGWLEKKDVLNTLPLSKIQHFLMA